MSSGKSLTLQKNTFESCCVDVIDMTEYAYDDLAHRASNITFRVYEDTHYHENLQQQIYNGNQHTTSTHRNNYSML